MNNVVYKDMDLGTGYTIEGIPSVLPSFGNILTTPQGKLPGTPEFGFGGFVFGQNDDMTKALLEEEVISTMNKWDSRISILSSEMVQNENYLSLNIEYSIANATPKSISIKIQEL